MKDSVWAIILVVVVFSAFTLGYSVAPMIEVGLIGGTGEDGKIGLKSEVDDAMAEYYRSLAAEDEDGEQE